MLIPSDLQIGVADFPSLSRRVNANSQHTDGGSPIWFKLIKKGEC